MTLFRTALNGLVNFLETAAGAVNPTAGFSATQDHCPHCDDETVWHVSVLHQFYLCTKCGRDPKLPLSHYETAREKPGIPADTPERTDAPAAEPVRRKDGTREVIPA